MWTLDTHGDHLDGKVSSPFFFPAPSLPCPQFNSQAAQVSTYRLVLGVEQETAVFSQIANPKPTIPLHLLPRWESGPSDTIVLPAPPLPTTHTYS